MDDKELILKRIAAIDEALSKNIHSMKFEGNEIVFRSFDEMRKSKAYLMDQLQKLNNGNRKSTRYQAIYKRD